MSLWRGWLLLVALIVGCPSFAEARPNILLAIGDNWAWPHAGALGDPTAKTPVFDRIAREGVVFTHVFCPVPSCSPTRSCILTGRVAHQLSEAASLWSGFPRSNRVFTDMLGEAGYDVGFTGKGWAPGNHKDYGWPENPAGRQFAGFDSFLAARDAGKPFFFWLGNTDTALNKWRSEPATDGEMQSVRVPPEFPDAPEVRANLLDYYGAVKRMDDSIGAAIAALEKAGLLDDTIVVYTSDNGWQMPRGLANCYDTGTRVPFAVRWGKNLTAGRRADEFIDLTDLAPTFLELAGLKPTPEMTARSFADVLLGKTSAAPRDHVFIERERHANVRRGDLSYPVRGIRTREYLYLRNLRPEREPAGDPEVYWAVGPYGDVDGSRIKDFLLAHRDEPAMRPFFALSFAKRPAEELYDLRKDPHQLTNVADQAGYATAKKELRARVEQWMRDTKDPRVDPSYDGWDTFPYFGGKAKK